MTVCVKRIFNYKNIAEFKLFLYLCTVMAIYQQIKVMNAAISNGLL